MMEDRLARGGWDVGDEGGPEAASERVAEYVRETYDEAETYELRHFGAGGRQALVRDFAASKFDARTLSTRAISVASRDADGLTGIQKYALIALMKSGRFGGRCIFSLGASYSGGAIEPSSTSVSDQLAQQMSFSRVAFQISVGTMYDTVRALQRELRDKAATIAKFERRHFEIVEMHEALKNQQHERDLETRRQERRDERLDRGLEIIKTYGPDLFAYVRTQFAGPIGRTAVPNAQAAPPGAPAVRRQVDPADLDALRAFLTSLDDSDLEGFAMSLNEKKRGALLDLMERFATFAQEARSEAASSPAEDTTTTTSPEV